MSNGSLDIGELIPVERVDLPRRLGSGHIEECCVPIRWRTVHRLQPAQALAPEIHRFPIDCGPADMSRIAPCDLLRLGQAVQAEIKAGKRRITEYLLSPISRAASEAGRK